MKNILFIHQSADLYGSDKTLLLLLLNLDKTKFKPVVVLPNNGVLKQELEKENIEVVIAPVLKLYRNIFTPNNIISFIKEINIAFKIINNLNYKYNFSLIYSNTLAVLLGILFARKNNIKHLWHVHEIIEKPNLFKIIFIRLLSIKSNTKIVYNSIATQKFWEINSKLKNKGTVIWNGIQFKDEFQSDDKVEVTRSAILGVNQNDIVIALVGRISRWKGQLFLLEAFNEIYSKYPNLKLIFIGSPPPNQEKFQRILENKIKEFNLFNFVKIIPFQNNILNIWNAIDIAVVPSIEPEPFGMVAIEAMYAKKPVVGSNHGGLTEIIINNETGFLFAPKMRKELIESLEILISDEKLRKKMGLKGYERVIEKFSVTDYVNTFEKTFLSE